MNDGWVVVDSDPGIDDAVALALVVMLAGKQLRGVTTTYGNCSLQWATANACDILALCGAQAIPVVAGAEQPLCRFPELAIDTHGADGLGYARARFPDLCPGVRPSTHPHDMWGPDALVTWARAAAHHDGLTLVCLGPLTNLALALARDCQSIVQGVHRVVVMGGSAGAAGNTTPVSEFNFWADPEAARAVFQSGLPLTMVGLDVTRCMVLKASAVRKLTRTAPRTVYSDLISVLMAAIQFYVEFHRASEALDGCILNDPLAILTALCPQWCLSQKMYVDIICNDGPTRGQSICDRFDHSHRRANAEVCLHVDAPTVMQYVWDYLAPGVLTAQDLADTE